jgi:hypothetical protein
MRRLTIVATLVIIAASLAIGIYLVSTVGPSGIDKMIGRPVTSADMATLNQLSKQPYGSANGTGLGLIYSYSGTPFTSGGKPIVVYVGAEFCQFCAISRWGLILAMERFGNFSGLEYMASANPSELDLPTYTFAHAQYTSPYLIFHMYEAESRDATTLSPPPTNISTIWQAVNGNKFPFVDFGNRYVLKGSVLDPTLIQNKNWSQIYTDIANGDAVGQKIIQSANMITSVICKITGGSPAGVCTASPINTITSSLAAPFSASIPLFHSQSAAVTTAVRTERPTAPRPDWSV